jgi:hypothetical protein
MQMKGVDFMAKSKDPKKEVKKPKKNKQKAF